MKRLAVSVALIMFALLSATTASARAGQSHQLPVLGGSCAEQASVPVGHSQQSLLLTGNITYVDDDALNDPGPGDPNVSDPLADGSPEHPFDSVGAALDFVLSDCDLIQVLPGEYSEGSLYFPNCDLRGSGRSVTVIRLAPGDFVQFQLAVSYPTLEPSGTIADLTLEADGLTVESSVMSPGDLPPVFLMENTDLVGTQMQITAFGGWIYPRPTFSVTLNSVSITSGGLQMGVWGGGMAAALSSILMDGGPIGLGVADGEIYADLTSIIAPASVVVIGRNSGGYHFSTLADSTLGGLNADDSNDRYANVSLSNVHFTGSGIHAEAARLDLSVAGCSFDAGGVDVFAAHSPDVGTAVVVSISNTVFRGAGVSFSSGFGLGGSLNLAKLRLDSSRFIQSGFFAAMTAGSMYSASDGTVDLLVTNSIFDSGSTGATVSYAFSDFDPVGAHADVRTAFVNNTFYGSSGGIMVEMNPHIPGQHTATTVIENNIIVSGATGIEIHGTQDHQFTIAANDVFGNTLANYAGDISDQTGVNGNISAPPLFSTGYHLSSSSPCLDAGVSPAQYSGYPPTDLAGDLRLRDYDGDGLATADMGVFEETNPLVTPGEVANFVWNSPTTMTWDALAGAVQYHIYRGQTPFSYSAFGTCQDGLDADRTDLTATDSTVPPVGVTWSYLITGEDGAGAEGTLGFAQGAQRSNFAPCP